MAKLLQVENIHLNLSNTEILGDVSFALKPKESIAISGISGQGKSSLMNIIAGIDLPSSGKVTHGDFEVTKAKAARRAAYRKQNIGSCFQQPHLIPSLNAYQNVLLALEIARPDEENKGAKVEEMLDNFQISQQGHAYADTLSGGEQRRVALARAFIASAPLILLDEPLAALDAKLAPQIIKQIFKLNRENKSMMIIASHEIALINRCKHHLNLDKEIKTR